MTHHFLIWTNIDCKSDAPHWHTHSILTDQMLSRRYPASSVNDPTTTHLVGVIQCVIQLTCKNHRFEENCERLSLTVWSLNFPRYMYMLWCAAIQNPWDSSFYQMKDHNYKRMCLLTGKFEIIILSQEWHRPNPNPKYMRNSSG